jgi:hypothetical protein
VRVQPTPAATVSLPSAESSQRRRRYPCRADRVAAHTS